MPTIYGLPSDGSIPNELNPLKWQTSRSIDTTQPPPVTDRPVVTWDATMGTAMTTPVEYKPKGAGGGAKVTGWNGEDDPNILFAPGVYETAHGGASDLAVIGAFKPGGSAQTAGWPLVYSFQTSANVDRVELSYYGKAAGSSFGFMVEVNGRMVDDVLLRSSPLAGSSGKMTLTFPVGAARLIKVYGTHQPGLAAIRVPAGESITKPARGRVGAVVGDSFANGAGRSSSYPDQGASNLETFAPRVLRALGYDDMLLAAIGGTGYTTSSPYSQRAQSVLDAGTDLLLVYGSVNDGQTGAGLQADAEAFLASVAAVPEVVVIPTGVPGYDTPTEALRAAAEVAGRPFVEWGHFFTGTGKVTDKRGDGNRDVFRMADGTHPTLDAHRAMARVLFHHITELLGW